MADVVFFSPPVGEETLFLNLVDEDKKYAGSDRKSFELGDGLHELYDFFLQEISLERASFRDHPIRIFTVS